MASKQFLEAIRKTRATKDLSDLVVGSNTKYLAVGGPHDVYIKAIDTTNADNGSVKVTYADDNDKEHSETVFLVDRDGDGLSYRLRLLLGSLFGSAETFTEAVDLWLDAVSQTDEAWGMFTGMKLRFSLERGQGFRIDRRTDGFIIVDEQTGQQYPSPKLQDAFETVDAARSAAEAHGYKKSFPRTKDMETRGDEVVQSNANALRLAIEARQKAKAGAGRVGQANAGGPKKVTSIL